MHKVRVSCLPRFIPEHIELDVSDLGMNDSIHIRDIKIENVKVLDNESAAVVAVVPPTIIKEETPATAVATDAAAATAATTAEPEVIAKGKKPAEGDAPAAPAKK